MKETIERLRELEKDNLSLVESLTSEGIKLSQLRGEIEELKDTIKKYQRREDEHCRQIAKLEEIKQEAYLKGLEDALEIVENNLKKAFTDINKKRTDQSSYLF